MLQEILNPVVIISGLGLVFGLGLAYASKKFEVEVDERVVQAREILPGANCGACGYSGCDGFAEAVVQGEADTGGCPVGGAEVAKKLAELVGKDASEAAFVSKVARVICAGSNDNCKTKYNYSGVRECTAANALYGGPSACNYGCLGMGDCARACPFGAIVVENGVARVLTAKCTGCGKCVEACPKNIIKMWPADKLYTVTCNNPQRGRFVTKVCKVGCIGCRKCSRVCEQDAITNDGFVARINPDKCVNCGKCVEVCPNHTINIYPVCPSDELMAANK